MNLKNTMQTTELIINEALEKHYKRLSLAKQNLDFKKLKPVFLFENYYFMVLYLKDSFNLYGWIVNEMIAHKGDVIIVYDERLLNQLKTFTSSIYNGISKTNFESIQSRIFKYDDTFNEEYSYSGTYKVLIPHALNVQFKTKLFDNCAKCFKETELLLGFN